MALIYFSISDRLRGFHREPFIRAMAKNLAKQQQALLYFSKPRFVLSKQKPAAVESAPADNIHCHQLITLLPMRLAYKHKLLRYLLVALPIKWQVARLIKRYQLEQPTAWFYKPDQYLYLSALKLPYVYLHYDDYQADADYPFSRSAAFADTLKRCINNSLVSFATSERLIQKLPNPDKVQYLANAVDEVLLEPSAEVPAIADGEILGLVGTIDQSISASLIEHLCASFPQQQIKIIGPVSNAAILGLQQRYANLNLVGKVPYQELAGHIAGFSVGLCPYADSPFNRYRNPLKIYEYLTQGLPVVSSECDFSSEALALIYQADNEQDFIRKTAQALAENSADKRQQRLSYIAQNTWQHRSLQALKAITQARECQRRDAQPVFRQLLKALTLFEQPNDALNEITQRLNLHGKVSVSFANAHAFNMACKDRHFLRSLLHSDLLLRDGIGVKLLCRSQHQAAGANLNGTDFIPLLLKQVFAGQSIALLGTSDEALAKARPHIENLGLKPVLLLNGFLSTEHYLHALAQTQPQLVLLAMGMPKQEYLSVAISQRFATMSVINGGAIVDFMAGEVSRAPLWLRQLGMEWTYRLYREPKRLFKRYVWGNTTFMSRLCSLRLRQGLVND
ncbi:WecB/TagA/CpsF family glycosyltransferase [Agarivorans sp.]|uniref:WecB/TagA/CpsF family glycosyltransferase n=1 Tax=Agarivorans sp. TaxID=1872412 RepID=UPI003D074B57